MINRDTAVKNKPVLKTAAEFLTLRTSVPTAQMHVQALYDFMNLSLVPWVAHMCIAESVTGWILKIFHIYQSSVQCTQVPRKTCKDGSLENV